MSSSMMFASVPMPQWTVAPGQRPAPLFHVEEQSQSLFKYLTFLELLRLRRCGCSSFRNFQQPAVCRLVLRQSCLLTAEMMRRPSLHSMMPDWRQLAASIGALGGQGGELQLGGSGLPDSPAELLALFLPCLAAVEQRLLHGHPLPPLHVAFVVHALRSCSLPKDELPRLCSEPTGLWADNADYALRWSTNAFFSPPFGSSLSLQDVGHPLTLWLSSAWDCAHWQRTFRDMWRARIGQPNRAQAVTAAEIERQDRFSSGYIREMNGRVRWIGGEATKVEPQRHFGGAMIARTAEPDSSTTLALYAIGYYFGDVSSFCRAPPSQPGRLHYSSSSVEYCQRRMADATLDWSKLPVVRVLVYQKDPQPVPTPRLVQVYQTLTHYLLAIPSPHDRQTLDGFTDDLAHLGPPFSTKEELSQLDRADQPTLGPLAVAGWLWMECFNSEELTPVDFQYQQMAQLYEWMNEANRVASRCRVAQAELTKQRTLGCTEEVLRQLQIEVDDAQKACQQLSIPVLP